MLRKAQPYILLVLFSLLLFMPGISTLPVIDRDEAHFAQATRQMLQNDNFFQIRFQETTRFQKPPGINWLQAGAVRVFTNSQSSQIWPYRIPSVLGGLLSVLLTCYLARRFLNERTAIIASAMLASSLLLVVEAHMAVIDASLLFSVVLMEGALWVIYQGFFEKRSIHWCWPLIFWLAMTFGMVLKGVTPLMGVLSISALCLIERNIRWLQALMPLRGLLLFTGLTLMWVILINQAEHSNYLLQMINHDLLPKFKGGHESHGKPPLFHLALLPLTFWPASLFLWQGATHAWRNRQQRTIQFLLAWLLPIWIFFELMPTKLPQYVLPAFPALAMLCAIALDTRFTPLKASKSLRLLQSFWFMLSAGFATALVLMSYLVIQQPQLNDLILLLLIGGCSLAALYLVWHARFQQGFMVVMVMAALSFPIIFHSFLPALQPAWLSRNIAEKLVMQKFSPDNPVIVVGFEEPSLVFNLNTHLVKFSDSQQAIKQLMQSPMRRAVVELNTFHHWQNIAAFQVIEQTRGFNYSKGRWVDLVLVRAKKSGESKHATI